MRFSKNLQKPRHHNKSIRHYNKFIRKTSL